MSDFAVEFEWVQPGRARGPELRATWARLCLRIDGVPITRVFDRRSQTVREGVYVPLYPLAEWLAGNWWALWNEAPVSSSGRSGFAARHCLREAREGYALPPLEIKPAAPDVQLSWEREQLEWQHVEFLETGHAWAAIGPVRGRLEELVDAVVERLSASGIEGSLLQEDWCAIRGANRDEAAFCRAAGALGLDPYALDDHRRDELVQVEQGLSPQLADEFFGAADPDRLTGLARVVDQALDLATRHSVDLPQLRDLRNTREMAVVDAPMPPWDKGYAAARQLRSILQLDGRPLPSNADLGRAFGGGDVSALLQSFTALTGPFKAVMGVDGQSSAGFVVKSGHPTSVRFSFCRALYAYLAEPDRTCALVTEAATESQQRNRAFAAEFLAPASGLAQHIRNRVVHPDEVEDLADRFGVSSYVVEHQIDNHHLAGLDRA